jgi:hypothetical protein
MTTNITDPVTVKFTVTVTVDRHEWAKEWDVFPADVPQDIGQYILDACNWTSRTVEEDLGGTVVTELAPADD